MTRNLIRSNTGFTLDQNKGQLAQSGKRIYKATFQILRDYP